jgi:hypothetical protein
MRTPPSPTSQRRRRISYVPDQCPNKRTPLLAVACRAAAKGQRTRSRDPVIQVDISNACQRTVQILMNNGISFQGIREIRVGGGRHRYGLWSGYWGVMGRNRVKMEWRKHFIAVYTHKQAKKLPWHSIEW